ncbi:hypothetical protein L843_1769 [Mycobacterium intracellulare MIN_061107_1834]|nr:hypothetical protein L843_1769 [Mycobacterium intracellulare MIN_061107_1834]
MFRRFELVASRACFATQNTPHNSPDQRVFRRGDVFGDRPVFRPRRTLFRYTCNGVIM